MAHHGMSLLIATFITFLSAHAKMSTTDCWLVLENPSATVTAPTDKRRQAVNSLALLSIKPQPGEGESNIHQLDPTLELQHLSRLNLERLSAQLRQRMNVSSEDDSILDEALSKINFLAIKRLDMTGLASLQPAPEQEPDFYSKLTQTKHSLGFQLTVIAQHRLREGLGRKLSEAPYAGLNSEPLQNQSMIMPQISSVFGLVSLFAAWEPQILERAIKSNRWNLPSGVTSVEQFMSYINDTNSVQQAFPDDSVYVRLALLREHLHRFVLTETDAKTFSLLLLKLHALKQIQSGASSQEEVLVTLNSRPADLLWSAFMAQRWEGLEARIPEVTPEQVSLLPQAATLRPKTHASLRDRRSQLPAQPDYPR